MFSSNVCLNVNVCLVSHYYKTLSILRLGKAGDLMSSLLVSTYTVTTTMSCDISMVMATWSTLHRPNTMLSYSIYNVLTLKGVKCLTSKKQYLKASAGGYFYLPNTHSNSIRF